MPHTNVENIEDKQLNRMAIWGRVWQPRRKKCRYMRRSKPVTVAAVEMRRRIVWLCIVYTSSNNNNNNNDNNDNNKNMLVVL